MGFLNGSSARYLRSTEPPNECPTKVTAPLALQVRFQVRPSMARSLVFRGSASSDATRCRQIRGVREPREEVAASLVRPLCSGTVQKENLSVHSLLPHFFVIGRFHPSATASSDRIAEPTLSDRWLQPCRRGQDIFRGRGRRRPKRRTCGRTAMSFMTKMLSPERSARPGCVRRTSRRP